jgi:hypothetical protein
MAGGVAVAGAGTPWQAGRRARTCARACTALLLHRGDGVWCIGRCSHGRLLPPASSLALPIPLFSPAASIISTLERPVPVPADVCSPPSSSSSPQRTPSSVQLASHAPVPPPLAASPRCLPSLHRVRVHCNRILLSRKSLLCLRYPYPGRPTRHEHRNPTDDRPCAPALLPPGRRSLGAHLPPELARERRACCRAPGPRLHDVQTRQREHDTAATTSPTATATATAPVFRLTSQLPEQISTPPVADPTRQVSD